ncbi:MAG: orotate phosphoribosyltransferase [Oscillibacter sp.]|nr:orotate phosphoribosyltransferase [Oscillibacter sp.]
MSSFLLHYPNHPALEVVVHGGHFATRTCHKSHYVDVTPIKHDHLLAREAGLTLATRYLASTNIDTILCLDGSEVIGAFLAWNLAKKDFRSINEGKNIHVVTPEYDRNNNLIFRENLLPMVENKDVLVLISTVNSGSTAKRALECVSYYGGRTQGIAAVFSAAEQVEGVPVFALFTPADIPGYVSSPAKECPLCAQGEKINAVINSYGFSKL